MYVNSKNYIKQYRPNTFIWPMIKESGDLFHFRAKTLRGENEPRTEYRRRVEFQGNLTGTQFLFSPEHDVECGALLVRLDLFTKDK